MMSVEFSCSPSYGSAQRPTVANKADGMARWSRHPVGPSHSEPSSVSALSFRSKIESGCGRSQVSLKIQGLRPTSESAPRLLHRTSGDPDILRADTEGLTGRCKLSQVRESADAGWFESSNRGSNPRVSPTDIAGSNPAVVQRNDVPVGSGTSRFESCS